MTVLPRDRLLDSQVLDRIRGEYLEMPGLRLTLEQARRLCGVERTLCKRMLDALVGEQFLCLKPDGAYVRLTEGTMQLCPAKAELGAERRVARAS